ncbi:ABC-F family ATP-binding cassette domain-containing protein [Streptomyces sp. Wb2n-11]|uniref:ABC-F family ATP-binding cassette domain-containing protein n=1 Tax=Streptomyces sp. Wb2n-11 TaxID=1030533 RepID=UPI000A5EC9A2|nr:ATP-binding cassette domain-containing protein [Streptomyces sp. Wb2n-11]
MGHIDVNRVSFHLPDGRPLLADITFRVGDGDRVALVGPNGAGKTTLTRVITQEIAAHAGVVTHSGRVGVMSQFVGGYRDGRTVRDLLVSVSPPGIREAARKIEASELSLMERDSYEEQMAYAQALADWAEVGGYEQETHWDVVTIAALGVPWEKAQFRSVDTLSGGEQKRLVLETLLRGQDDVLVLDEPDNYLDVPGKEWLEDQLLKTGKSILIISHDRELLSRVPTGMVTLEPGAAGATAWTYTGTYTTYDEAREQRNERLEELRRRWDEEHAKIKDLIVMYRMKAKYNSDMASRLRAAESRLQRFLAVGPPEAIPVPQTMRLRLEGGRTAKRAVVAKDLELTGLMKPFGTEIWFGERVGVLGSNGSGKSHFLRLLACGGTDPESEHQPVSTIRPEPVEHGGRVQLGARVRPGWFAQTHQHASLKGRTLLDILHRGDEHRAGRDREEAGRILDRYGLAKSAEQPFESLSGGQQARFQILLLELSGATLLLLDEPTDNLDLYSVEALEQALSTFEGTVVSVTHDRWFAKGFDRFLVFGEDGRVRESTEPVWDEGRVRRAR